MKRVVAKPAVAKPADKPVASPCPRCGQPLTDPQGIGWCQGCGYVSSLEEDKAKAALQKAAQEAKAKSAPKKPSGIHVVGKAAKNLIWIFLLVAGIAGFILVSQIASRRLRPETFERCLWTTLQIAGGIFFLFTAQFIGLLKCAPEEPSLTFKDMFAPFYLWNAIVKRLPRLHVPVWLGGWGVAAIVSACVFIGGLDYWLTYMPGGKNSAEMRKKVRF